MVMQIEYGLIRWEAEGCTHLGIRDEWVTDRCPLLVEVEQKMTDLRDRIVVWGSIYPRWVDLDPESKREGKIRFLLRQHEIIGKMADALVPKLLDLICEDIEEMKEQAHVAW